MLERFVDGLKKSASRALEFPVAEESAKPQLFVDFLDGIKVAAGSAHQLFHNQHNPNWLQLRDVLEGVIAIGMDLPTFIGKDHYWPEISKSLDILREKGQRLVSMRAVSRQDLMKEMDRRLRNLDVNERPN